jgi:hypothetical protein
MIYLHSQDNRPGAASFRELVVKHLKPEEKPPPGKTRAFMLEVGRWIGATR